MRFRAALLGTVLLAGPAAGGEVLTWDACLAEAARNNPDLAAARLAVDGSRARLGSARGSFLPTVSASAGYERSGAEGSSARDGVSAGLSGRQNIFAGFATQAAYDRAEAGLRQAEEDFRQVSAGALFDLSGAFTRLLFAQEQDAVARAIEARRRENVRLVELRFQAGREHRGSFLRSKASHAQARFDASRAARATRLARRELAAILGRPAFDVFNATGTLSGSLPGDPPDFTALAGGVPASRRAAARVDAARASLTTARSRFYPDVSATGAVSRSGSHWPPERDAWRAGVNLSYPLFSGGADAYDARAARTDRDAAREGLRGALLQAALDLEDAFSSYQDAAGRVEVQEAFLEAAELRSQIARRQYENGLLTFDDWDIIENDLISQETSALAARRDAALARARWDFAQGNGMP